MKTCLKEHSKKLNCLKKRLKSIKSRFYKKSDDLLSEESSDDEIYEDNIDLKDYMNNYKNPRSSKDVHSCVCDFCYKDDFNEYRYKCLICDDYDLCGTCFESRKINQNHALSHALVRFDIPGELFGKKFKDSEINLSNFISIFQNEKHHGVKCKFCSANTIRGLRFKCDICNDFNLCSDCYKNSRRSTSHSFNRHPVIVQFNDDSLELDEKNIELLSLLGSGGFGTVYKSKLKSLNNKIVASKIIQLQASQSSESDLYDLYKSFTQELKAYTELKGVNILKMFGHCIQKTPNSINLIIVTEFMSKGSLTSLLENESDLSFRKRFQIVCDVAAGMRRIHDHNFIHRDIRPDNILIDSYYTAKIGDMGISKLLETRNKHNTLIGCPPYLPPEFFTGNYDQKLDIFTFGLTLNIIFNGRHNKENRLRHFEIIKQADVCREYVNVCTNPDPTKRPESKMISENLEMLKKRIDQEIFTKEFFRIYKKMTTEQKNSYFKALYNKINNF
jgi:hypothetical protein